jgi:hypothetical protein
MNDWPPGTRVTYDEEPLDTPEFAGVIVEPTAAEIAHGKTYDLEVGPDYGDLLVEWEQEGWNRSWEHPSNLRRLAE